MYLMDVIRVMLQEEAYITYAGEASAYGCGNTRSRLSASAQVILQPMTVEQRELMITRLWCCRPAADVV